MTLRNLQHNWYSFRALRLAAIAFVLVAASGYAQTLIQTVIQRETATSLSNVVLLDAVAQTATAEIRPFHFHATDEQLADLRRRVAATRWPERETVNDAKQGVQLATMQKLAQYWATDYDWRKVEARLNALPMFVTTIDGLDIQFIHVRSKNPHALPVIITHGWPGSVIEQLKVIGPLTDPVAYGGKAEDSFDVVIPSLPTVSRASPRRQGGLRLLSRGLGRR